MTRREQTGLLTAKEALRHPGDSLASAVDGRLTTDAVSRSVGIRRRVVVVDGSGLSQELGESSPLRPGRHGRRSEEEGVVQGVL
jgi:hypothetical protein